jgi:flagellar motor switch protein FliN/FliY
MLELAKNPAPQVVELPEATQRKNLGAPLFDGPLGLVKNVKVKLSASLGAASITVAELADLKDGSILKLDKGLDEVLDLVLEGQVIAHGRLVAVGDHFGLCITEVATPRK